MKRPNLFNVITLILFLYTGSAIAQKSIYFIDYAEVPPEVGYRSGYIVTLQGDTIYGKLRNTESVGRLLTPRVIHTGNLDIELKNGGELSKIAFIPESAPKSEQRKFIPGEIRAFGYQSAYLEQQPIELESAFGKSGFITKNALKRVFTFRDPYEDIHLLQRLIYDRFANFESIAIDGLSEPRFLQRRAEGKNNLYYDTEHDNYYISKYNNPGRATVVNYGNPGFLDEFFGDSKKVGVVFEKATEMKRPENFVSVLGIYNLEADGILEQALTDYIITAKGDTLQGGLEMKGLSSLTVGTINKVKFTPANGGKPEDMQGMDIKRIVKYINNTPVIFDAYNNPKDGKRLFYQLQADGKIKLYYDPRSTQIHSQTLSNDVYHGVGSYLIVKKSQEPLLITKTNFDEQLTLLFADASHWNNYTTQHPEKKQYDYLPQLVSLYNSEK